MTYSPATRACLPPVLLLVVTTAGRADPIAWSYSWSNSPTQVNADAPGTGYLTLSNESTQNAAGDSDIVATNIKGHSPATTGEIDTFTNKTYTLTLTLTDLASGASNTLAFTGELNGTLTAGSSLITNTFTGPTTQTLVLGDNAYTVTIDSYTAPGPPGSANAGSIGALATVAIFQLPEPGTLTLSGLGASFLVLAGWRRRGAG